MKIFDLDWRLALSHRNAMRHGPVPFPCDPNRESPPSLIKRGVVGQDVVGREVSGVGRRGAELRGAGRHWGNIPGAERRGAGGQ